MDTTEKFNGLAEIYTTGRPTYADKFLADLYETFGFSAKSVLADIGSGTGKFAKQMIERGSYVYCIEPNEDMRKQLIKQLEKYENSCIIEGDAANTTLPDHSVDFITVAQAFHWFDTKLFKNECNRIIKEDGRIFLIWNIRDMNLGLTQESYDIYKKYCPEFKGFGGGIQKDDTRIKVLFDDQYERLEYDNPLLYDRDKFINRSLLGSYSLKQNDVDYGNYINELELLFDKYSNNDVIIMPNKTIVYVGMCMGN